MCTKACTKVKTTAQHDQKVVLRGGFLFGFESGEALSRQTF